MKKQVVLFFAVIAVIFMANTAFSQSNSDFKMKIESINKEMVKDMLEGNNEKLLNLYTQDAVSMPSYQPLQDGLAAIKLASEEMAKTGVKYTYFTPTTLKVLTGGNLITEIGTYKIGMSMPSMDKPIDDHGKYLTVWEKQKDGSLKIKVEIWNSDIDPMSMMNKPGQTGTDKK